MDAASLLAGAWREYGDARSIERVEHVRTYVSTNQVYRLLLSDGSGLVAKVSSFGSYYLFREDHDRIHLWFRLLQGTRYASFLSDALTRNDRIFTFTDGKVWVIFYKEVKEKDRLPRVLSEQQIVTLARETAAFHRECDRISRSMPQMSKTIKSDIVYLLELLDEEHSAQRFHLVPDDVELLWKHCHAFLSAIDAMRYDYWHRIPVLIDWNISNFSVQSSGNDFTFFSRWDYDWFRMEPRTLDFYFMSRVVRSEGDRTYFSYTAEPLLEERFFLFLKSYHVVYPLAEADLFFLKEAYRFFILNYVIKDGVHFFQADLYRRLIRETVDVYLPTLERLDFSPLAGVIS